MARPLTVADYKDAIRSEIRYAWRHILLAISNIRKYRLLMKQTRIFEKLSMMTETNKIFKIPKQNTKSDSLENSQIDYVPIKRSKK